MQTLNDLTQAEQAQLSEFINACIGNYPTYAPLLINAVFCAVDRYTALISDQLGKTDSMLQWYTSELLQTSIMVARHTSMLWSATYTPPRSTWEARVSKNSLLKSGKVLDLVFASGNYENLSPREVAAFEMTRFCTTRNGLLTAGCMAMLPALHTLAMNKMDKHDAQLFDAAISQIVTEWCEVMVSYKQAKETGEDAVMYAFNGFEDTQVNATSEEIDWTPELYMIWEEIICPWAEEEGFLVVDIDEDETDAKSEDEDEDELVITGVSDHD